MKLSSVSIFVISYQSGYSSTGSDSLPGTAPFSIGRPHSTATAYASDSVSSDISVLNTYVVDPVMLEEMRDWLCSRLWRYWSWEQPTTEFVTKYVRRRILLSDSVDVLMNSSRANLALKRFKVRFIDEAGVGDGVHIDWITSLAKTIFSDIFLFADKGSYKVLGSSNETRLYAAIGRFLAYSIVSKVPIGVVLPVYYWALVLEDSVTLEDVMDDEPELFKHWTNFVGSRQHRRLGA